MIILTFILNAHDRLDFDPAVTQDDWQSARALLSEMTANHSRGRIEQWYRNAIQQWKSQAFLGGKLADNYFHLYKFFKSMQINDGMESGSKVDDDARDADQQNATRAAERLQNRMKKKSSNISLC